MKKLLILLCISIIYGCTDNNNKNVVVKGTLDKKSELYLLNINHDLFGNEIAPYIKLIKDADGFVNLVSDSIAEGYYNLGRYKIIYLRPGLSVKFQEKDEEITILSHKYMNRLSELHHYRHAIGIINKIKDRSFREHCKEVDNLFSKHYKFLDEVTDYKLKEVEEYYIETASLMLKAIYSLYQKNFKFDDEYMKIFNKIKFDDERYLMFKEWKSWLNNYFYILKSKDKLTNDQRNDFEFQSKHIDNIRIKKKWLWENILDLRYFNDDTYKNMVFAKTVLTDTERLNKINQTLSQIKNCTKGSKAFEFEYESIDGNKVKLSELKGNYVYIDFWGVYCGACITEIPYLKKIEHKYANKKIKFVSICLAKDKEKWKALVNKHKIGGVNLFTNGDKTISNFYNIRSIPRFIIIDKEGNLVNSNAPRPSNVKLESLLDELTKS